MGCMDMMRADDLLGIPDLKQKRITVPQWGKEILIQELGLLPMMEMYQSMNAKDVENDKVDVKPLDIAKVVAMGVVNDDGSPVFTDDHIPALARKNRAALLLIYTEIMALSGTEDEAEKN